MPEVEFGIPPSVHALTAQQCQYRYRVPVARKGWWGGYWVAAYGAGGPGYQAAGSAQEIERLTQGMEVEGWVAA